MGVLSWIVLGFLAGGLAGLLTGQRGQGCITKIVVGVVGGLLGGWLARLAGVEGLDGFGLRSIVVATIGAVILLLALQVLGVRRRR